MKKVVLFAICCFSYFTIIAQNKELSNIKIDTVYYDKYWKVAQSPLFADYYRLIMSDSNTPQAGYKIRDYFITGELQGDGSCSYVGINDDRETIWNGKLSTYYKSGKISSIASYENGELNGDVISYYENGLIETKKTFVQGKIDGVAIYFTDNGSKCKRVEYVNGELKHDYYEIIDERGCYGKFSHKDDKIKWLSPSIKERQLAYSNGKPFYYYENNGLTVSVSMSPVQDYGKYYKFNVMVSNNSCEPINIKLANIGMSFKYPEGAKVKNSQLKLHVLPYFEYETKIRKRQNAVKALTAISNGINAAKAGYSSSSTTINSGYAGGSAVVGGAAAFGSGGWAVGAHAGAGAYVGASSTDISTASYNGLAAYQASMIANAQYQVMSREMMEERVSKIDDYLKEETVFSGEVISGYFLIPRKIKNAAKFGGDICIDFNIENAKYNFTYHIMSGQELMQYIQQKIAPRLKNREISKKEAINEIRELFQKNLMGAVIQ